LSLARKSRQLLFSQHSPIHIDRKEKTILLNLYLSLILTPPLPQKDRGTLQNVFQYSVKYAALLVVPIAALVICLAEPAVSTLFGQTYASAPLFLVLLALSIRRRDSFNQNN
jgi:Polysaccharide biosynthesis protein